MPAVNAVPPSDGWTRDQWVCVFNLPAAWCVSNVAATAGLTGIFGLYPGFVRSTAMLGGIRPSGMVLFTTVQQAQDCMAYYKAAQNIKSFRNDYGPTVHMIVLDGARLQPYQSTSTVAA